MDTLWTLFGPKFKRPINCGEELSRILLRSQTLRHWYERFRAEAVGRIGEPFPGQHRCEKNHSDGVDVGEWSLWQGLTVLLNGAVGRSQYLFYGPAATYDHLTSSAKIQEQGLVAPGEVDVGGLNIPVQIVEIMYRL